MTSCPFSRAIKKVISAVTTVREKLYNHKRKSTFEMPDSITPEEWVLAFIFAGNPSEPDNAEIKGKLLFTKEFFVFIKEIMPNLDSFFNFIPYDYGPYSFTLISIVNSLIQDNMMSSLTIPLPSGFRIDYKLTSKGVESAKVAYESVNPNIKKRLERLRSDATKMGYLSVLSYVYSKYPEYTTASKIKDQINNDS